jgi:hypothetical protein
MDIYEALYTTRAMRRLKPDPIPYDVQARIGLWLAWAIGRTTENVSLDASTAPDVAF